MEPHKFPLSDSDHLIPARLPLKRSLKDSISDFEDLQRPHKRMSVCWQNHAEESTESRFSNTSGSVPPRPWSLKSEAGRAVRGGDGGSNAADVRVHLDWSNNQLDAGKRRRDEGQGDKTRAAKIQMYKRAKAEADAEWETIESP